MKMVYAVAYASLGLLLMGATPMPSGSKTVLYPDATTRVSWWTVNDTVMGGVSRSQWVEPIDGLPYFRGVLSLDNNGGFTSVRSSACLLYTSPSPRD